MDGLILAIDLGWFNSVCCWTKLTSGCSLSELLTSRFQSGGGLMLPCLIRPAAA
jgi:hypothetical protein